jgi:hypothetical protein
MLELVRMLEQPQVGRRLRAQDGILRGRGRVVWASGLFRLVMPATTAPGSRSCSGRSATPENSPPA